MAPNAAREKNHTLVSMFFFIVIGGYDCLLRAAVIRSRKDLANWLLSALADLSRRWHFLPKKLLGRGFLLYRRAKESVIEHNHLALILLGG